MYERLVESWLDNASERSYQAPFCQILAYQGHTIVHSSRHSPVEFGKDVITLDDRDVPCAFQLKANPGSRMNLTQFREILPQLREMIDFPIEHPSVPRRAHRSFLVTNGNLEEEVSLAITQLNRGYIESGLGNRKLEVITKGTILRWVTDAGVSIWPSEFEDATNLLELMTFNGRDMLPTKKMHTLLQRLLGLEENNRRAFSAAEVKRRITSAALLVAVAVRSFELERNHYALISGWVMYATYVIACCERYGVSYQRNAAKSVALALAAIEDRLIDLSDEVNEMDFLVEGDPLVDSATYRARYTLVTSLLSILWLKCEREGWPEEHLREKLEGFLDEALEQLHCWGEGAALQILAFYWYLSKRQPNARHEALLESLLESFIPRREQQYAGLPSPYYTFQDIARHQLARMLGKRQDPLYREAIGKTSYLAEGLLHLLVRTGRKQPCKALWPGLTRMSFMEFRPSTAWEYCLWRTKRGEYQDHEVPFTKQWHDLVEEARDVRINGAPAPLLANPLLLLLHVIQFPYRARPAVIRYLGWKLDDRWFIDPPRTE